MSLQSLERSEGAATGRRVYPPDEGALRSSATTSSGSGNGAVGPGRAKVLVVSFGSAPGTPNWGGVLSRVGKTAETPEQADFDVVYIVDPFRSWYQGALLPSC